MSSSEDEDSFDNSSSSDDSEQEEENTTKKRKNISDNTKQKRKKLDVSLIDDAAVLSGEEDDEDEDEDDGEDNDDYVRDDFVVDEVDEKKENDDGLEDSDDDSSDDDGEQRGQRIRKMKDKGRLDDDDLALIDEAKGVSRYEEVEKEEPPKRSIKARTEAELRKELFDLSDEEIEGQEPRKSASSNKPQRRMETYDEDGMDDFIEYGEDEDRRRYVDDEDDMMGQREGISEAQLNEATDIFGTDFMDFFQPKEEDEDYDEEYDPKHDRYRERGVGVDLGVESDEEMEPSSEEEEDDDDLFGDDEDADDLTKEQRAEALRLKREKRQLAKEERRRATAKKRSDRRRAKLRRAFEPVQLVENFCTERDDEIRSKDIPERFFDWSTPFHGPEDAKADVENDADFSIEEQNEATWMIARIPEIQSEYNALDVLSDGISMEDVFTKQREIVVSIMQALRYMHIDHLEPEFIRKYRADYVTSKAVRDNLFAVMDEDTEWDRILNLKKKVEGLIDELSTITDMDEAFDAEDEHVMKLKDDLKTAEMRLIECTQEHDKIDKELKTLEHAEGEDLDDELFGDDDEEAKNVKAENEAEQQKVALTSRLTSTESMMEVYAEQVAQINSSLKLARAQNIAANPAQKIAVETASKVCRDKLWNSQDYKRYLNGLTEFVHVLDLYKYLKLVKEGTDAIRTKSSLTPIDDTKRRSRRFDRDYYRTCASQGLREICYQFALSPLRAGIKLEDNTLHGVFDTTKSLPGDSDAMNAPGCWDAPIIGNQDPTGFASALVSSGELVLLSSGYRGYDDEDPVELTDPLRGCRYVAAMELASEPRIRRYLRQLYRSNAVISTRPTSKGLESIDAHHEFYGLHLLRNKSISDHFPINPSEVDYMSSTFSNDEKKEHYERKKREQRESCIQYLNILKAERTGHLKHFVHLPLSENEFFSSWYNEGDEYFARDKQDYSRLLVDLQRIYLPLDSDEWNEERNKILKFALTNFLLPQFEAEVKQDLREASIKIGVDAAGKNLSSMANEGPYRPSHLLGENSFLVPTGDLPIVGVCCSNDGKEASYLAAVSERGVLIDHLAVPAGTQIDSNKMRDKLITFLMQSRPAAIVVGCLGGLSCRLVARKLGALVTEATEKWNNRHIQGHDEDDDEYFARQEEFNQMYPDDDETEQTDWKCNVEMVDDNVAQLFGRSVRGRKEFPDAAINLRCAVAIARHAKDPLSELAYTYCVASDAGVFGTEMLFMNIHPMQQILPKTLLLREYERVLCRAVAEVGVDINTACKYDHLLGLLTFVPGLGPRKGANLKNNLERIGGVVASRKEILKQRLLGPTVYNNAIAFLRIRNIDTLSEQYLHPLDDTRLHPDVYTRYKWATKIAIDALEMDDMETESSADKEDRAISAINDIMMDSKNEIKRLFEATKSEWERTYGPTFNVGDWDPRINVPADSWRDKVEELDLETFAEIIEKNSGFGRWLSHLSMIKWEFRLPFEDPRKPMEPLDREKLFRLLTGETDQSLCPGKEITGKVARISDFGAHLKLEGDIPAFIPRRNLADGHVESAEGVVQVGAIVTAVITEVKKDHISVDLSLTTEDFKKPPSSWPRPASLPPIDSKFDLVSANEIEQLKSKEREERLSAARSQATGGNEIPESSKNRTKRVTRRACAHPAFRNATNQEIERELNEGGEFMVGEALIRPSSKHADCLAVHWLCRRGCIKVVEVVEEDKDNDASIGNILKIKNDVYGSIDELLARYIAPMNDFVQQLVNHRKFLNMAEEDVDEKLRDMKRSTPSGVFYFLCWNEKYPGYASLRYIFNTPRYHHIGITPEGFLWNNKNYSNLDALLNDFKKNPRGTTHNISSSKESLDSSMIGSQAATSSRASRWGARSSAQANSAPSLWTGSSMASRPPPPAQLPPPPQHAFRPAPPNLPPPALGQAPSQRDPY